MRSHLAEFGIFEHPVRIRVGLGGLVKLFRGNGSQGLQKRASLRRKLNEAKNVSSEIVHDQVHRDSRLRCQTAILRSGNRLRFRRNR